MEENNQGSKLGEMMDLYKKFEKEGELIFRKIHRELIKNGNNKSAEFMIQVTGFGLACLALEAKLSGWMKLITEEINILEREESGSKEH